MRITTQAWETYIRRLAQLNEKAAQLMAEYLAAHGIADTEALTDYAAALVQKYGEGSAELACQMYDAMAALQNARVSPAEPAAPASRREVARMVQATRESPPQMQRGVSRLVKRAGADTTLKNAQRDGAEFAWVPHGDSCAFCLTLASRGWQRASQAAIKGGHAEHREREMIFYGRCKTGDGQQAEGRRRGMARAAWHYAAHRRHSGAGQGI